ncbi:Serine/threonine protein phosphatase 2C [Mycena indigotica]|uniref:Serine/threonine protein phosphatase 2C n=1 Tax=Mycena indigotica TaxID=2126181 RepID=A0A8H6SK01_9AGAR|nr:Serine/threonine protein phosphatase 2C [Mycena indigotica]KAF7301115.1 Serine/threonine protein phosphatase 2C [Mycena indigotica]
MSEAMDLYTHLIQAATLQRIGNVDIVAFDRRDNHKRFPSEDRYYTEDWKLLNGIWKLAIVLDGHGGTATVDFVLERLPSMLKLALESALQKGSATVDDATLTNMMSKTLIDIEEEIKNDLLSLIPTDPDALAKFDAAAALQDSPGNLNVKLKRVLSGTTAMVALIDPDKRVHIASVGDCDAFLCFLAEDGSWDSRHMGFAHRCTNSAEKARILAEHPGEPDCISSWGVPRLLGLHTLSRAIGNTYFNLPVNVIQVIGAGRGEDFEQSFLDLVKTPPYLSNVPEVAHDHIDTQKFLVLASDGLETVVRRKLPSDPVSIGKLCGAAATKGQTAGRNLAGEILFEAMGGDSEGNIVVPAIEGKLKGRLDDATILVISL